MSADGAWVSYIADPVADPVHIAVGELAALHAASSVSVDSGQVVDCDTVQPSPRGHALAWRAGRSDARGGGVWRDLDAAAEPVSLTTGDGGGRVSQVAFSPDGKWIALVLSTVIASSQSQSVLRLAGTEAGAAARDVPLAPDLGVVSFGTDGRMLLVTVEGSGYRNEGSMHMYAIDPDAATPRALGAAAGTRDDLALSGQTEDRGFIRVLPRLFGQKLVFAVRGDTSRRGTLAADGSGGARLWTSLSALRAFSNPFGAEGGHVFAYTAPSDDWSDCCALWDVELATGEAVAAPDVPNPQNGVIPLLDGRRVVLPIYAGTWSVWDRDLGGTLLVLGAWRELVWTSPDGRYVLGLDGPFTGPFALRLGDLQARAIRTLGEGVYPRSVHVMDGGRVLFVRDLPSAQADATGGELALAHVDDAGDLVLATSVAPQIAVDAAARRVFYAVEGTPDSDGLYARALPP